MAKKTNEAKKSSFFRECVGELKKVTWPTRDDVWASVKVVIALSFLVALILWGLDVGFTKLFQLLLNK